MKDTVFRLAGMPVNSSVLITAPGHVIPSVVMDVHLAVSSNAVDAPTARVPV